MLVSGKRENIRFGEYPATHFIQPTVDDMRLCRADDILDLTSYSRFGRMVYKAVALIDPSLVEGSLCSQSRSDSPYLASDDTTATQ